jgi:hypothetical protein
MTIARSKDFIVQHRYDLADYYQALVTECDCGDDSEHNLKELQEILNKEDLIDIAHSSWDDLKDEERGLIALLCNRLL